MIMHIQSNDRQNKYAENDTGSRLVYRPPNLFNEVSAIRKQTDHVSLAAIRVSHHDQNSDSLHKDVSYLLSRNLNICSYPRPLSMALWRTRRTHSFATPCHGKGATFAL